ncbi:hypothetical protein BIV25_06615 [Streptomyces sp. MUSC 14]|uniref:serine hydrolase n=1 Tax=Streptomyces sp. MUSC 14 TaxID=1354889 RepID=UPI0008F59087|nr:serine hydrolase domain-containing protein [Streptomyces sp. MUSC 14]OIK00802.1 hypothetical protein BIV25_06615 [Streptomyces sp. MUSC 14]
MRQSLQHTSGPPDYVEDVAPDLDAARYRRNLWTTYASEQRVASALRHRPSFTPGTGWTYSNTDYVLLGMVIQAVTGRSWGREVRAGIVRPPPLTHTRRATGRSCPSAVTPTER